MSPIRLQQFVRIVVDPAGAMIEESVTDPTAFDDGASRALLDTFVSNMLKSSRHFTADVTWLDDGSWQPVYVEWSLSEDAAAATIWNLILPEHRCIEPQHLLCLSGDAGDEQSIATLRDVLPACDVEAITRRVRCIRPMPLMLVVSEFPNPGRAAIYAGLCLACAYFGLRPNSRRSL